MKNQIFVLAMALLLVCKVTAKKGDDAAPDASAAGTIQGDFVDNGIYNMYVKFQGFATFFARVQFTESEALFKNDVTPDSFKDGVQDPLKVLELFLYRSGKAYIPYLNLAPFARDPIRPNCLKEQETKNLEINWCFLDTDEIEHIDFLLTNINRL